MMGAWERQGVTRRPALYEDLRRSRPRRGEDTLAERDEQLDHSEYARFAYDADGKQVMGTVNGVTTYYVGSHYEKKNDVVTKYYFAGATRLAVRTGETLSYLLADHIGSSSVTTNADGALTASALYKAFGETRYTLGNLNTDYKFTGQREETSLGIYWFQSRWFDAGLGRFTQPDSIIPGGAQGNDRYAFVGNNPVNKTDPSGHRCVAADGEDDECLNDDGSRGGGFTGIASSSKGESSDIKRGCGGLDQFMCGGAWTPSQVMNGTTPINWPRLVVGTVAGGFLLIVGVVTLLVGIALFPEDPPAGAFIVSSGAVLTALSVVILYQVWRPYLPSSWPEHLIFRSS